MNKQIFINDFYMGCISSDDSKYIKYREFTLGKKKFWQIPFILNYYLNK